MTIVVFAQDVICYTTMTVWNVRKNDEERNPDPSLQKYEPKVGQMPADVLPKKGHSC